MSPLAADGSQISHGRSNEDFPVSSSTFQMAVPVLREWIEPYLGRLYGFAFALTQDRDQSCDLVQDCVLRALAAASWPSDERACRAWLFRILRNAFIDRHRKSGFEVSFDPVHETYTDDAEAGWHGDRRIVDVVTVRIAIDRLTPTHREIIALVDFAGLSYRETAEVLGIAEGTVMSRLARARKALLAVMETENVTVLARARKHIRWK